MKTKEAPILFSNPAFKDFRNHDLRGCRGEGYKSLADMKLARGLELEVGDGDALFIDEMLARGLIEPIKAEPVQEPVLPDTPPTIPTLLRLCEVVPEDWHGAELYLVPRAGGLHPILRVAMSENSSGRKCLLLYENDYPKPRTD